MRPPPLTVAGPSREPSYHLVWRVSGDVAVPATRAARRTRDVGREPERLGVKKNAPHRGVSILEMSRLSPGARVVRVPQAPPEKECEEHAKEAAQEAVRGMLYGASGGGGAGGAKKRSDGEGSAASETRGDRAGSSQVARLRGSRIAGGGGSLNRG